MPRPKQAVKKIRSLVNFDPKVYEALEFLFRDPFTGRMKPGKVSDLVNALLKENLNDLIELQLKEEKADGTTK